MNKEYTGNILDLFKNIDNVAIIHGNNCENNMGHITHVSGNKSFLLCCFPDEVEEILIEKYNFKKYTPSVTAKAYASVIEDEEDYSEYHGC